MDTCRPVGSVCEFFLKMRIGGSHGKNLKIFSHSRGCPLDRTWNSIPLPIAFLTTHRKDIMHVGIVGLCSGIFLITGLSFTVFSIALRHDLNIPDVMTAGMVTSLSILAIGLILGLITWRLADELLDRYEEEEVTNEPLSLGRAILNSVLNSFMGTSAVPHNHRDNNYMPDRNMLN